MSLYVRPLEESYIWDRCDPINNRDDVYEWLREVELEHGVDKDIGTSSRCETDGVYQTVAWTVEGNPIHAHNDTKRYAVFSTPKLAWAMWVEAFRIYKRNGFKIYWRRLPELHQSGNGFIVSARVFISFEKEGV